MIIKKTKPVEFQDIQRFANIYGFPYDNNLIDVFYNINGGTPIDFNFLYGNNIELKTSSIKKILSFNSNDNDNIEEAMDIVSGIETLVPFAITEDDDYLCYYNEDGEEFIKLFCVDTEELFDVFTEDEEIYTPSIFFSDLEI